ncbi:hypothetical protein LCGC14_2943010, partial [marine sediment metagenome]
MEKEYVYMRDGLSDENAEWLAKSEKIPHTRYILKNHQCPGDILMLSACVRDIKAWNPHFELDVRTSCDVVFDNNPHITKLDEGDPSVRVLDMHYEIIHQSNQNMHQHFIHGFIKDFNEQAGCSIKLTQFKPDLHLTKEEKETPKVEEEVVEETKDEEVKETVDETPDSTEDTPKEEVSEEKEEAPVEQEFDVEEFKKTTVEETQKAVMEKLAVGLGLTTEEKKQVKDELIPPWEQRGESKPKSYKELVEHSAEVSEWKRKKEDERIAKVQEDQDKEAKKDNKRWNDHWDTELKDLVSSGKIPAVKDDNDPNDLGKQARIKLFAKMNELALKSQVENKPMITSMKLIFYEHYN